MATGARSATYDYNAFGETIQSDGVAAVTNHFRFSTKYTDDESGLLYYDYRYYTPSTGRWLSRDLINEKGGVNLYAMLQNCPVNNFDPFGLSGLFKPDSVKAVRVLTEKEKVQTADTNPREILRYTTLPDGTTGYYYRKYVTKRTCFYRVFCKECCDGKDRGLDLEPKYLFSPEVNVDAPSCSGIEGLQWAWSRAGAICNAKIEYHE
jgi:RHS repeat-associated protein